MERHYIECISTSQELYCVAERGNTSAERIQKLEQSYKMTCLEIQVDAELEPNAAKAFEDAGKFGEEIMFKVPLFKFRNTINIMLNEGRRIADIEIKNRHPFYLVTIPRHSCYKGCNANELFDQILINPQDVYKADAVLLSRNHAFLLFCDMIREGIAQRMKEIAEMQ